MFTITTPRRALRALLIAAITLPPATLHAAVAASDCTDRAWANYNTCLMNSGGFEWAKKECDIEFQAEYAACYGAIISGLISLALRAG